MDVFLGFALLASLGGLAAGLVRPGVVRLASRGAVAARLGTLSLVLFFLVGVFATPNGGVQTSPSREESAAPIEDASFSSTPDAVPPVGTVAEAQEGVPTVPDQEGTAAPLETPAPSVTSAPAPVAANHTIDETEPVSPTAPLMAVVDVVDGDTITVSVDGTVETIRLIGIDTPETKDPRKPVQCFGQEASAKAKEILAGRRVRLEADDTQGDRDKYGRLLRYVWRDDGLFFNEWMIRNGYAHEYTYDTPYRYQATFKEAQQYASDNDLGLWSPTTCAEDTTSAVTTSSDPVPVVQTSTVGHTFYTSSYRTATFYYCDTDPGWESLSPKYLESFPSESALLARYPSRDLHAPCE